MSNHSVKFHKDLSNPVKRQKDTSEYITSLADVIKKNSLHNSETVVSVLSPMST